MECIDGSTLHLLASIKITVTMLLKLSDKARSLRISYLLKLETKRLNRIISRFSMILQTY